MFSEVAQTRDLEKECRRRELLEGWNVLAEVEESDDIRLSNDFELHRYADVESEQVSVMDVY